MASMFGSIKRIYTAIYPPEFHAAASDRPPLKFGILGAANIAPSALIWPIKNHSEAVVLAVAARNSWRRAMMYAKKYGIPKAYGGATGYQQLLDDPEIDVIYIALPNGLHFEWTMKALAAGKHVLLEKPGANTADETRQMFDFAEKKGLVLLVAFHDQFHPAIQRVKAILDSGELGAIKSISATLTVPSGMVKKDDIRFDYSLGGGALMDIGCYILNFIRYLSASTPTEVLSVKHEIYTPNPAANIDRGTIATLALPNNIIATLTCDLATPFPSLPKTEGIVKCEGGDIELHNFVMPTLYHSITVHTRGAKGEVKNRTEKVYTFGDAKVEGKGEAYWTTYRYQLEAFVDKVRGREPQTWFGREDAVTNIEWIEKIYEKSGLGSRPKSSFVLHT